MYKNYSLYSNCPPLASTHARSRCAIHAPPSQQFVGQHHSKLARFAYENLRHHGPLFCTPFPACTPYLIIDGIQIWAVRGPQCRIYESEVSFVRSATLSRALCAGAPSCWKM